MQLTRSTEHAHHRHRARSGVRATRALLAVAAAIAGLVAVGSSVGDGALPTASLPAFGVLHVSYWQYVSSVIPALRR